MDPFEAGNQPFRMGRTAVCNGEIYNFRQLIAEYAIETKTGSDCEVILPLYLTCLRAACKRLDGVSLLYC